MSLVPQLVKGQGPRSVLASMPMADRFVPRSEFVFPSQMPNWFPGTMAKALRQINERLPFVDAIIEVRDARLPLSSINPLLEGFVVDERSPLSEKPRLVIYNKRDLAERRLEKPLRDAMHRYGGHKVMFASSHSTRDCKRIIEAASNLVKNRDLPIHYEKDIRYVDGEPYLVRPSLHLQDRRDRALRFMLVGMPNVGKSSLINKFRSAFVHEDKAATVSPEAGTTRGVQTVRVRNSPPVYIVDTPGLFAPYLGKDDEIRELGMKLGLAAGLKHNMVEEEVAAEYLLYRLNWRHFQPDNPTPFDDLPPILQRMVKTGYAPTNYISRFMEGFARVNHLGVKQDGEYNEHRAAVAIMRSFERGEVGKWQLDDLGTESDRNGLPPPGVPASLATSGNRYDKHTAVDQAVKQHFLRSLSRTLRPFLSNQSKSQLRVIAYKENRLRLGLPALPPRSAGQRRLARLEKKRFVQWELAFGPSRLSEGRQHTLGSRNKKTKLPSWLPRRRPRRYSRIAADLRRQVLESEKTGSPKRLEEMTIADVDWSRMPLTTIMTMPEHVRDRAMEIKANTSLLLPPPEGYSSDSVATRHEEHNLEREAAKEYLARRSEPGDLVPMVPDTPSRGTIVTTVPHLSRELRPIERPGLTRYAETGKRKLDHGLRMVARTHSQRRAKQRARRRAGVDQEVSLRAHWRKVQRRRRGQGIKRAMGQRRKRRVPSWKLR